MQSRRSALKIFVGATGLLVGVRPRSGHAASAPVAPPSTMPAPLPQAPPSPPSTGAPLAASSPAIAGRGSWELIAPYAANAPVALGWRVADLGPIVDGAATLTLRHESGELARVAICRNNGQPRGVAYTDRLDFILMNGGRGDSPTNEALGRVLMSLAELVRAHRRDLRGLMTHAERLREFAPPGGALA